MVVMGYDACVSIVGRRSGRVFYILKRPHLALFLHAMSLVYEIVIFTASIAKYADAVIEQIDTHRVVSRTFARTSCTKTNTGLFVKDLRVVCRRSLRRTIIVDNSPAAYSLHPNNAMPVDTWTNDRTDTQLLDAIPFLQACAYADDVRPILTRRNAAVRNATQFM